MIYDIRESRISFEDRRCSSILYYYTEPSVLTDANMDIPDLESYLGSWHLLEQ